MNLTRFSRFAPRSLAAAALISFGGCLSIDAAPEGIGVLIIVSGNNQTLAPGSTNAAPLVVRALDQNGAPLPGETVTWGISQGSGAVSASTTITDNEGNASVNFTAPTATGTNSIRASAEGLTVTFTIQVAAAT